jgi:hypothetical protein
VHRVEVDGLVLVAEGVHRLQPRVVHDPVAGVDDVLDDDVPVAVVLGEARDVPHRGAGPLGGLVGQRLDVGEQVALLGLALALDALGLAVVRALRAGPQDRRWSGSGAGRWR